MSPYGVEPTSEMLQKSVPAFLVVGAQKAGTSPYVALLEQHPEVYVHPRETFFFNAHSTEECLNKIGEYQGLFAEAGNKVAGEKCGAYCNDPDVPGRIRKCLPDVRLIWLLREPVSRSYSGYWHAVLRGKENRSFDRAIREEPTVQRADDLQNYASRSWYAIQIKRYLEYFDRSRMLFILYEQLIRDPNSVLRDTWGFLGVNREFVVPDERKRRNPTGGTPRSVYLYWYCYRHFGPDSTVFRLQHKLNRYRSVAYPGMRADTRELLLRYFQPRNRELAEITGLDLSVWESKGM